MCELDIAISTLATSVVRQTIVCSWSSTGRGPELKRKVQLSMTMQFHKDFLPSREIRNTARFPLVVCSQ
jgi:hypothetical protein